MDFGIPLATHRDNPIVFPSLGMTMMCVLQPDHAEPWARCMRELADWIGPSLRWTVLDAYRFVRPFRPVDLEYGAYLPKVLNADIAPFVDQLTDLHEARVAHARAHDSFTLDCHAGSESWEASAISLSVRCEALDASYDAEIPSVGTMLRLTVAPDALPRLLTLADQFAESLPIRWGSLGFTYSGLDTQFGPEVHAAINKHARRHVGFDHIISRGAFFSFQNHLRSVNFVTYVGSHLLSRLATPLPTGWHDRVTISMLTTGTAKLVAGDRPEMGDVNRLDILPSYRQAHRLVAPLVARTGLTFGNGWDPTTTTEWLTRFERVYPSA